MLLYIVRHGDPIYSPDSLTELGKIQAQAVAKRVSAYGIDRIYSSPLIRAKQTAEPTAILTKKDIIIADWMSEDLAWKDFSIQLEEGGKAWPFSIEEYRKKMCSPKILKLGLEWYEDELFDRERIKGGYERILNASDDLLKELGYVHDRENCCYNAIAPNDMRVAAFCHGGFGLSWIATLLDIPLPIAWTSFAISHSGVTVIEFGNKAGVCMPKMLTMSNDSHLYREGIPTKYDNIIYI